MLYAYLYASWPRANFHLFNWVAFLLAGSALAPLALGPEPAARVARARGGALRPRLVGGHAGRPSTAYQSFWRTSPSWFAMRLAICLAFSGLLQLVPDAAERPLAWLTRMGRQSLVGYIASVELTYGAILEWLSWKTAGGAAPEVALVRRHRRGHRRDGRRHVGHLGRVGAAPGVAQGPRGGAAAAAAA